MTKSVEKSPKSSGVSYPAMYSLEEYTFPQDEVIDHIEFTETHMVVYLEDGRFLGIPLSWIPSVANAAPADRERYFLSKQKQSIHWDPEDGPINDDLRLSTYLGMEKEKTRGLGRT